MVSFTTWAVWMTCIVGSVYLGARMFLFPHIPQTWWKTAAYIRMETWFYVRKFYKYILQFCKGLIGNSSQSVPNKASKPDKSQTRQRPSLAAPQAMRLLQDKTQEEHDNFAGVQNGVETSDSE